MRLLCLVVSLFRMRFNANVVLPFMGMSLVSAATNACRKAVVLQAAEEGFLQHVLANCVDATGGEKYLGHAPMDAETCVSSWIAEHDSGSPIPESGDCHAAYVAFAAAARTEYTEEVMEHCPFSVLQDEVEVDDECVQEGLDHGFGPDGEEYPLDDFRQAAGYYIGGEQCSAETVRVLSQRDAYHKLIAGVFATPEVNASLDLVQASLGDGLCFSCYHNFFWFLTTPEALAHAENDGVKAACIEDPISEGCLSSGHIQEQLAEFKLCAGSDLIYEPPVTASTPGPVATTTKGAAVAAASAALAVMAVLVL